jgi:hypothetical protein
MQLSFVPNVFMIGPPGAGKTLLARAMPGILPCMTIDEALDVTRIYSVADQLPSDTPLIQNRPFRSPYHTISHAGLVGGVTGPTRVKSLSLIAGYSSWMSCPNSVHVCSKSCASRSRIRSSRSAGRRASFIYNNSQYNLTVSTSTPLFIGYTTLEEWITAVDDDRPVFANLITEHGKPDQYETRTNQLVILAAQPDDDLVNYCRLVVGEMRYVDGDPPDQRPIELAGQAWQLIQDWLKAQGFVVRKGIIAVPENLRLMNGWANFLSFDQKKQEYTAII